MPSHSKVPAVDAPRLKIELLTDEEVRIRPSDASLAFEKMMEQRRLNGLHEGALKPKNGGRKAPKRKDERFGE